MAKNIEPKLKKIGDYLKLDEDTVFTIPEYQRAYSWSIDNCDKLWQDINDFVDSDSKDRYFFGTIIINCQDDDTKYGLIDGQQRTTTFLLLLKALLVRINTAIERTSTDDDSAALCRGLQERRRRIMGILYGSRFITELGLKESSAQLLPKDSVLFSSRAPIGYIAIAENAIATNQGFKSVSPYISGISEYLYFCLKRCTDDIIQRASGTTFKEISGSEMSETLVPIPSLNEQKKIVNLISDLFAAINNVEASLN